MPKYLWKASYTQSGVKGVAKEGGSSRVEAVRHATESAGGTLEAFYFALGEKDAYVIADLPDNATAAAVAITVNGTGTATVETVALLTPEEVDEATKKNIEFRPAGG